MKKIGIITIHKSTNYGACLQAHALCKFIESLGYDCEIIDLYRNIHKGFVPSEKYKIWEPPYAPHAQKGKKSIFSKFDNLIMRLLTNKSKSKKTFSFLQFNESVKYSKPYKGIDELYDNPPIYDYYVTGSDQVWNPTIGIPVEPYFLTFTDCENKLSYASSFGVSEIKEAYKEQYKEWLVKYKSISVRESSGANIINDILGLRVPVVLDPTLLIGADYWREILHKPNMKHPYLLLFTLTTPPESLVERAAQIAKANNLKLVLFGNRHLSYYLKYHLVADAGPLEFIGWIQHADMVITNSFHGFAFSVMLNDNFYVLLDKSGKGKSRNSRIETLLEYFELRSRVVDRSLSGVSIENKVKRNELNLLLQNKQQESAQFLIDNLK